MDAATLLAGWLRTSASAKMRPKIQQSQRSFQAIPCPTRPIPKILKLKQKRRLAEVASLEEPAKTSLKGEPDYAASPLLREQNRCSPSETHQRFGAKRQNQSPQQRTILALWMPLVAFRVSMTSCACSTIAP